MKIITIASQKGGAGKTTIVQSLARVVIDLGFKTKILDFDAQLTSLTQYDKRISRYGVTQESEPATFQASIQRLNTLVKAAENEKTDYLFLDLPPSVNAATLSLCQQSDFVLIPTRPEPYDLESIQSTLKIVMTANVPSFVVINAIPPGSGELGEEAAKFINVNCNFPVSNVRIPQRTSVTIASANGETVLQTEPKGPAARDFKKLWKSVSERIKDASSVEAA